MNTQMKERCRERYRGGKFFSIQTLFRITIYLFENFKVSPFEIHGAKLKKHNSRGSQVKLSMDSLIQSLLLVFCQQGLAAAKGGTGSMLCNLQSGDPTLVT